jgi:hypothetical protein
MFRLTTPARIIAAAAFACCAFTAVGAVAQPKPAAPTAPPLSRPEKDSKLATTSTDKAKREQARRHFEQGVALYDEQNFAGALSEFEAAYNTAPAAAVLYNIGLTYKALFRYAESIETLKRYLAETATDKKVPTQRRMQVQQLIIEMQSLLAPVTFQVMPRNASILLDGRAVVLPDTAVLQVPSGPHVVEVSAEGFRPERREFTVAAGTPLVLEVTLAEIPKAGRVRISSSQPATRIRIDGKDLGLAPIELDLLAGGHQLEASSDGYETHRSELVVNAGQERNVDIEMQLPPAVKYSGPPVYKKWWFWTAVAAAVAGGTAAAFLAQPGVEPAGVGTLEPGSQPIAARR